MFTKTHEKIFKNVFSLVFIPLIYFYLFSKLLEYLFKDYHQKSSLDASIAYSLATPLEKIIKINFLYLQRKE